MSDALLTDYHGPVLQDVCAGVSHVFSGLLGYQSLYGIYGLSSYIQKL